MTGLKINLFSIPLATNKKTKIKKSRVREVTRLVRDKTPGCKTRGVLASASLDFGFVLPSVTFVFSLIILFNTEMYKCLERLLKKYSFGQKRG
jgi:hypothetical protein